MALTRVSPALFQVSNNITSVTVGGSANTISLTFDSNGVITGASNNAVSVANTAITGNIISSQITSVANTQITGNITAAQITSVANTQLTGLIQAAQIGSANATLVTSGTLPKARLPTGTVLQVVSAASVSSVTINSGSQTATGYSASITPTSATSKILISFYCSEFRVPGNAASNVLLYKNGSALTNVGKEFGLCTAIGGGTLGTIIAFSHLDSPATTSSTTYEIYAARHTGSGSLEFLPNGSNNTENKNMTLTLTEISA